MFKHNYDSRLNSHHLNERNTFATSSVKTRNIPKLESEMRQI